MIKKVGSWYIRRNGPCLSPSGAPQTFAFKVTKNIPAILFFEQQFHAISIEAWKACGIICGGPEHGKQTEKICFYESYLYYEPTFDKYDEVTKPSEIKALENQLAQLRAKKAKDMEESERYATECGNKVKQEFFGGVRM